MPQRLCEGQQPWSNDSLLEMCGIAGIISTDDNIESRAATMSESVAHRGPDSQGIETWLGPGRHKAAFAHRRLSIIDLSDGGRQPMRGDRCSIVYNGEIYNYRELRKELIDQGSTLITATDTEVVVKLYEKHGPACLRMLRGMFAFAIRDSATGEVFIARDRLGIKPVYYFSGPGFFAFCSEIRGLLASGLTPKTIDPVSLSSYLSFGAVQEPRTIVEGVRSLPPAHYLIVDASGDIRAMERYWSLPETEPTNGRREVIEETASLLDESVKLHLVADVPLGAFLSGGIDSSAIVALMSRNAPGRVKTFTVGFEEDQISEHLLARALADRWQTKHTEIFLSENEVLKSIPRAISDIDQPTIDGINTWVISKATKQAGITVALSGLGGDELFGGYPSFSRARRIQKYAYPVRWLNPGARRRLGQMTTGVLGHSLPGQKMGSTIAAGGDFLSAYASMRGLFSRSNRGDLLVDLSTGSEHRDYEIPIETIALLGESGADPDIDLFNRISRYELALYMGNMLLRDTDAMSMASSLEVRVPFLDHKLVEQVFSLPGAMKTGPHPKQLLIDALKHELPSDITERRKTGFALPFDRWIRTSLRQLVSDTLEDDQAVKDAGLNPRAVNEVFEQFERGSRSTSWSRVWGVTVLVDWCRRHQVRLEV